MFSAGKYTTQQLRQLPSRRHPPRLGACPHASQRANAARVRATQRPGGRAPTQAPPTPTPSPQGSPVLATKISRELHALSSAPNTAQAGVIDAAGAARRGQCQRFAPSPGAGPVPSPSGRGGVDPATPTALRLKPETKSRRWPPGKRRPLPPRSECGLRHGFY